MVCRLYRLHISGILFAGSCLAAAVGTGAVWYCGGFSIPAALIPTYIRRDLWLQGNLLFAVPLFFHLAAGLFLPLAAARKRSGSLWAVLAFAGLSGAACCTIFGAGMFSNRFKYFSLGALSDLSSPEWEHPHAIALAFAAALSLFFAASLCRLKFWRELTKQPCRRQFLAFSAWCWGGTAVFLLLHTLVNAAVVHQPEHRFGMPPAASAVLRRPEQDFPL